MVFLEARRQLVDADAGGDGETADVVVDALRGDEVGQGQVLARGRLLLLPQRMERDAVLEPDVVAAGIGAPETVDGPRLQQTLVDDLGQELPRIVEDFLRPRLVENLRVLPAQFPRGE